MLITSDPLDADQGAAERIAAIDFINAGEGSGSGCLSSDRHSITLGGVEARQEDLTCFGTDHLIFRLYFPGMPHRHVLRELELLAREVFPAFR